MKTFEVLTMERKTSFTREAAREAIKAVYAEFPSTIKRKKQVAKKAERVMSSK